MELCCNFNFTNKADFVIITANTGRINANMIQILSGKYMEKQSYVSKLNASQCTNTSSVVVAVEKRPKISKILNIKMKPSYYFSVNAF